MLQNAAMLTIHLQRSRASVSGRDGYRIHCPSPNHAGNGDGLNCSVFDGEVPGMVWAKCHSHGCEPQTILRALDYQQPGQATVDRCPICGKAGVDTLQAVYTIAGVKDPAHNKVCDHRVDCKVAAGTGECWYTYGKGTKDETPCDGRDSKHIWSGIKVSSKARTYPAIWGADPNDTIVLCEGAKAARAIAAAGLEGISSATWRGGANTIHKVNWSPLAERKVVLWPDRDREGRQAMDTIAEAITGHAAQIRIVDTRHELIPADKGADAADVDAFAMRTLIDGAVLASIVIGGDLSEAAAELMATELTAQGDASAFADEFGNIVLLVRTPNQKNALVTDMRMLNRDGIWQADEDRAGAAIVRHAHKRLNKLHGAGLAIADEDKIRKHFEKPLSGGYVDDVIRRVGFVGVDRADRKALGALTMAHITECDADGRYFGTASGVVDLKTGKTLGRAAARKHLVTRYTPIPIDMDATHPLIDALTAHWDPDNAEYLWALLGRGMWRQPDKTLLVLQGAADSGKSTIGDMIYGAVGRGIYAGALSLDAIKAITGRVGPSPELEVWVERAFAIGMDLGDDELSANRVKSLAGGGDTVPYRPLYQGERSMPVTAMGVIGLNKMVRLGMVDPAVMRRIKIIPCPLPEKDIKGFRAEFKNRHNLKLHTAALAKLLKYAYEYPVGAEIPMPDEVKESVRAARSEEGGPFVVWLDMSNVREATNAEGKVNYISRQMVWEAWCKKNKMSPRTKDPVEGIKNNYALTKLIKDTLGITEAGITTRALPRRDPETCWAGYRLTAPL